MSGQPSLAVEIGGRTVEISHPDKVIFPALGTTKLDLLEYYRRVGDALLAHDRGRPALLQRFPNGPAGSSFFQKRVPQSAPRWISTTVVSTPNGTTSDALVIEDLAHVAWAANLGCLGLHLWPYRAADPEHADELRIDLDPQPGTGFDEARAAGLLARKLLAELGLTGYPKTTGNRGLHVYLRLLPRWSATEVRAGAVALARELERRAPELVTAAWWKEERGARIFVDYNQNAPHKTVFSAWSVRARPQAQVSTPISWEELDSIDPESLTIETVPDRLAQQGDAWGEMEERPQSLEPLLELAARDRSAGLHDAPWPPVYPKAPDEPPRVAPGRARRAH